MNITGTKRQQNDVNWNKTGFGISVIKYILTPNDELRDFHKRMHECRIKLRKMLHADLYYNQASLIREDSMYKETFSSGDYKYERDMLTPEMKLVAKSYGFVCSKHLRSLAYQIVTPYKSYLERHCTKKKTQDARINGLAHAIPPRPIDLKEHGAMRFDEANPIIKDLTPDITKRHGKMHVTLTGQDQKKTYETTSTVVDYHIPSTHFKKNNVFLKECVSKSFGGNLKPIVKNGTVKWYEYQVGALYEFNWQYQPEKILAFDIGKRKADFLVFNTSLIINGITSDIIPASDELDKIITQLRNINRDIGNKNKQSDDEDTLSSKERKQHRLFWNKLQHREQQILLEQYAKPIIDYAVKNKCLLCIDDLTSGSANGEYGQKLARILSERCTQLQVPFVVVPTAHTSARCSKCGAIHGQSSAQRKLWRPEIDKFVCQNCSYTDQADRNAANNIAVFGYNIWTYQEKADNKKGTNGLSYRKNNNCLDKIPTEMLL